MMMCLSLKTLTSIIRTSSPIDAELIDLVNSVEIDVYILHHKYQVKSHSSPWFSSACTAVIGHTNHLFSLCMKRINFQNLK